MHTLLRLIEGAAHYEAELIATERRIPPKERAAFIARRVGALKQVRTARAIVDAKGSGVAPRQRRTKRKGVQVMARRGDGIYQRGRTLDGGRA